MALFGRKKKTEANTEASNSALRAIPATRDLSRVIIRPVVTEKAARVGEQNVYVFFIARDANKYDVRDAMRSIFKVVPTRVTIVNRKPTVKFNRVRGRLTKVSGEKKAYVYLKKGDTIEVM